MTYYYYKHVVLYDIEVQENNDTLLAAETSIILRASAQLKLSIKS